MRKALVIIFLLLVLVIVFEGGFYLGANYSKSKIITDNLQNITSGISKANQNDSLNACLTTLNNQSQPEVASRSLTPGVDFDFLKSYTQILLTSNNELLKEASISYTLKGHIVSINKNATFTLQGKTYDNYFILMIEDPLTHVATAPYRIPYKDIDQIKIRRIRKADGEIIPASVYDLYVGKLVEVQESGDLKNKKSVNSTITIID